MREKCLPIAFLKVNLRRPLLSTPRYLALCRCAGNLTFNSLILWGTVLHGLIKKKRKPKPWVFIRPLPAERPFLSPSCVLRGLGNTQLTALSLTLLVSSLPLLAMERAQSSRWRWGRHQSGAWTWALAAWLTQRRRCSTRSVGYHAGRSPGSFKSAPLENSPHFSAVWSSVHYLLSKCTISLRCT